MLYIWPYIAFFSAPLIVGPFIQPIASLMPQHLRTFCKDNYDYAKRAKPSLVISIFFILGGLAAVHFNTIIHPYTLADNRHYVFYVFRILRRHPAIKYLAVPVYYICAWLVTRSLGLSTNRESAIKSKREAHPTTNEADSSPCQASFILVWLAATALSVITAPLVEPRYFIVPWILWRLHLPYASASLSKAESSGRQSYDMRLVLETVWLLAINGAVTYIFLQRGFTWPSEPGKIQRFIW
jgi:alpha-1,2-glucosyltransferase